MSKTVVITGAGVGLGRAIARRLAKDGHRLALLGRTPSKVEAVADELGDDAAGIGCDVSDSVSVAAAFAAVAERFGSVDVLVNNAAVYQPYKLVDATDEQILQPILTNYAGTVFCCRAAIPLMGPGGQIINVSSEGVETDFPMLSLYNSTKAAIERFSRSLRDELEPDGITVNVFRAGQMGEEGKTTDWPDEIKMAFGRACMERGINLMTRPVTHFNSVAEIFAAMVDAPADLQLNLVSAGGRKF